MQAELDAGADIVGRSLEHNSATPLHLAILNDADVEVVALLLDRGAKLSARYNQGMTPLHAAVANYADMEIIELLLDRGANVKSKEVEGRTPLGIALVHDAGYDTIDLLLTSGAEVIVDGSFIQGPLYEAAVNHSDPAVLELLFAQLSDGEPKGFKRDYYVDRALSVAAGQNTHPQVVEWLLDQGANIEGWDPGVWTPLEIAVAGNPNPAVIELLLDRGADVYVFSLFGREMTPLHWAVVNERLDVITMLINRGADIEAVNSDERTPLFLAADLASGVLHWSIGYPAPPDHVPGSLFPAIIALLVDRGADIDAIDRHGNTPLHRVAMLMERDPKFIAVVESMLAQGASVDARNHSGATACEVARGSSREAILMWRVLCPWEDSKSPFSSVFLFPESDTITIVCTMRFTANDMKAVARWGNVPPSRDGLELSAFEFTWLVQEEGGATRDWSGKRTAERKGANFTMEVKARAEGSTLKFSVRPVYGENAELPGDYIKVPCNTVPPTVIRAPEPELLKATIVTLLDLYRSTGGPAWTNNTNWASDSLVHEWYGVTTDEHGRLISLDLANNGLRGKIPPELGDLANLTGLDLRHNQLSGSIPPELGNLTNLTRLDLDTNQLSGPIPPELGNLANLIRLDLGSNQLSGPIPPELGQLSQLRFLSLSSNRLSGHIPSEVEALVGLHTLYLNWNQLSGEIPNGWGDIVNWKGWHILAGNQLTGCIPHGMQFAPGDPGDFDWGNLPFCSP